jgi:hypothetical protein
MRILAGISPPEYNEKMVALKEPREARTEWIGKS